jgi:hypothetical protein
VDYLSTSRARDTAKTPGTVTSVTRRPKTKTGEQLITEPSLGQSYTGSLICGSAAPKLVQECPANRL